MNYTDVLSAGSAIIAVGLVVLAFEELRSSAWLAAFYNWSNERLWLLRGISCAQCIAGIMWVIVQLVHSDEAAVIVVPAVIVSLLLLKWRVATAHDGADRMYIIVMSAFFTWELFARTSTPVDGWVVYPYALMIGLAYFDSGRSKVIRKHWRTGRQFALIMNSKEFGSARIARFLLPRRMLCCCLSWSVIIIETTAIIPLLMGGMLLQVLAPVLILMHAGIALIMGLGRFFYPFSAGILFVVGASSAI